MSKYGKKIVYDYIYGNDVDGFDIEELENDSDFMMEVISLSNDKNFYNLCSDNVKRNYNFIKFIISKFRDDKEFICDVVDEYLEYDPDALSRTELLIIMCDLTRMDKENYSKYKMMLDSVFSAKRVEVELTKIKNKENQELVDEIGMGFWLVFDSFNSSDLVVNFYAKEMIKAIFDEYDIDLERYLHNHFEVFEDLEKIGINNYMINFIALYDSTLSSYISGHIDLLKDMVKKIEKIKQNWNSYIENMESLRYDILLDYVHRYMEYEVQECLFSETELLYFIGRELGIDKKIFEYDSISEDAYNSLLEEIQYIDKTKMSFNDLRHYNNLKKIIVDIISSDVPKEPCGVYDDVGEVNCEVIPFKKIKRKKPEEIL